MPSPILARADALMQGRRLPQESEDIPILTDTIDEDIPLLQVDGDASAAPGAVAAPSSLADMPDMAHLANELTRRVERRLARILPDLIATTVREILAEQGHAPVPRKD